MAGKKKAPESDPGIASKPKTVPILVPYELFPCDLPTAEGPYTVLYARTTKPGVKIVNNHQVFLECSHMVTIPTGHIGLLRTYPGLMATRVHLVNDPILTPGSHKLSLELENRGNVAYRMEYADDNKYWFKAAVLTVVKAQPIEI